MQRNLGAPVWFDHRFRFKPASYGPANITVPVLAVTGACMYVKRAVLDAIGLLDERYPMAYEDVDWCLRAWAAGWRVLYFPPATLEHHESVTRGTEVGEREQASQTAFWERWGEFFDGRGASVRTPEGKLRVVYVTEDTGVGGGHRDIFEHLNGLLARGHDVKLFTLGEQPDWFDLDAPVHTFEDYDELTAALAAEDAIKVATWWNTGTPVWTRERAARPRRVLRPGHRDELLPRRRAHPLRGARGLPQRVALHDDLRLERASACASSASSRRSWRRASTSTTSARLPRRRAPRRHAARAGSHEPVEEPAADDRRVEGAARRRGRSCACSASSRRSAPRTGRATSSARATRRSTRCSTRRRSSSRPRRTRASACRRWRRWRPAAPVVCTDSHGNRDFCVDGENCLMPEPTVAAVSAAIARLLADAELRARLGEAGRATAADYTWERRIDELEAFLQGVAAPRGVATPRS